MNAIVEQQFQAEILLCDAIAGLIEGHDYSVFDVRAAVGAFTGEILGRLQESDRKAAARLARHQASDGPGELHSRWVSHVSHYPRLTA